MLYQEIERYCKIETKLRETMAGCLARKQMACRCSAKHVTCCRMVVPAPCVKLNIVVRIRTDEARYHAQVHVDRGLPPMVAVKDGEIATVNEKRRTPNAIAGDLCRKLRHRFGIVLFSRF